MYHLKKRLKAQKKIEKKISKINSDNCFVYLLEEHIPQKEVLKHEKVILMTVVGQAVKRMVTALNLSKGAPLMRVNLKTI